ncbi:hypothetical protein NPIL_533251 [Nephila pilipes]|uniref:Uncharacterized protein n=1 Tax=Nephila pilipes TaxID=299642 RepID=A0A8X6N518_NEPPI|nr:hypothetical protein NPIL_573911 [Nephila pilipes]GFS94540.1 hypothetical protein NPIL_533251 [Nephila pilipes]
MSSDRQWKKGGGSLTREQNRLSSKSAATTSHTDSIDVTSQQKRILFCHRVLLYEFTSLHLYKTVQALQSTLVAVYPQRKRGCRHIKRQGGWDDWQGCSWIRVKNA